MYISFSFIICYPDYTNSNSYSYILNKLLLGPSLGITIINTAVNIYFKAVSGGVGNNLNIIIIYLLLHIGIKFFKG